MNPDIRKMILRLIELQIQTQKIDEILKNVRVDINTIFWNIKESEEYKKTNDRY